jgi:pimeloyl-ACP methyl ester carboxylesterase
MQMMRFGPLTGEVLNPETEKFTAVIVLVHGLWERPAVWRRFAGYLAHRGWRCVVLERGDGDLAAQAAALRAATAAVDARAVLVGHDLGASLALACSDAAAAVVALAPLLLPPLADTTAALQHAGNWLRRWRGGRLRPPGGVWARAYPHRDLDEPADLIRRVIAGSELVAPRHPDLPRAVFAMERDELTPAAGARQYAEQIAADFEIVAGATHAILDRPEWERCVGAVHRWIVRRLGVELLALYDEAWAGRDP